MAETVFFNEMLDPDGRPRQPYRRLAEWFETLSPADMRKKSRQAETIFRRLGITFAVYGANEATERLIPFDIVPRVISAAFVRTW